MELTTFGAILRFAIDLEAEAERRYQQVAVVVRVAIQDYDALIGAPKDEIIVVLLRGIAVIADKTAGSLV